MLYRIRYVTLAGKSGHVHDGREIVETYRERAVGIARELWRLDGWQYSVVQVQDQWGVVWDSFGAHEIREVSA